MEMGGKGFQVVEEGRDRLFGLAEEAYKSAIGDPGMRRDCLRVAIEAWNQCNEDPGTEPVERHWLSIDLGIEIYMSDNQIVEWTAQALTNVASGTSEHTRVVIEHGVVPKLVLLLSSAYDDVRYQRMLVRDGEAGPCTVEGGMCKLKGGLFWKFVLVNMRISGEVHAVTAFGWAAGDQSDILSPFKLSRRHEIVGVVTEIGCKVQKFKVGDKVGVTGLVGACHSCDNCTNNLENYYPKLIETYNGTYHDGTTTYGGYSDHMVTNEHYVIRIPENMPLDAAAPLLCAGITTCSPLKYFELGKPGMHVGVVGLGGLGHVGVKFAKALGAKAAMRTMDGILDTVSPVHPLLPLIGLLKSHGKLIMLSAPDKPLELPVFPLLMGRKLVAGSLIGGLKEVQEMIDFAAKHNITADIEVIRMDYVNTAMERLTKSDVKYRFVIDVANTLKAI
ncbi:hypothetical protein TEA_009171 [Camellia sinensis var. sinensis]|uniref:Uncharacterized protein n=1 Tax=Camellia sinensis var. sinensis TaxID=542762 RepID=A0A4S4EBX0_CAMSN|nr:hypothetical protein TEA_009171 [Camellia sinensis var. sinensis]